MKKSLKFLTLLLLLSFFTETCLAKNKLKIGAILPLSGENEYLGQNIYKSILITIFELKNLNIEIIPLDTQSSSAGAKNALQTGINNQVNIFIGPIFWDTIKQIENEKGFKDQVFISYSNFEEKLVPNVINFGVNLSSQISSLEKYLKKNEALIFLGKDDPFSKRVLDQIKKRNVEISKSIFYKNFDDLEAKSKEITNFEERNKKHLEEINKLKKVQDNLDENLIKKLEKYDTAEPVKFKKVFISNFQEELITAVSFFDFFDANYKNVQFLTLNQWFNEQLLIEPSLEKIIFPAVEYNGYIELNNKYQKIFGRKINNLEVLTFDIIPLISATWFNNKDSKIKISSLSGSYKGKTGEFEIKNNKVDRKLNLYQIQNKKFKKI